MLRFIDAKRVKRENKKAVEYMRTLMKHDTRAAVIENRNDLFVNCFSLEEGNGLI